jgi:hypothetical protein
MRVPGKTDVKGSERWIRRMVNEFSSEFAVKVQMQSNIEVGDGIDWRSPLSQDNHAEYRDKDFLQLLDLSPIRRALEEFWPARGPQWDALGVTNKGEPVLVEAKGNLKELVSSASQASPKPMALIEKSLAETKEYLSINHDIPWTGRLYQYANRIAHLYYLRVINQIPAHLLFVYFIGDTDVDGPNTIEEWHAAITVAKTVLEIPKRNKLTEFIGEVFIDVREFDK